jgi:hypothetical protein
MTAPNLNVPLFDINLAGMKVEALRRLAHHLCRRNQVMATLDNEFNSRLDKMTEAWPAELREKLVTLVNDWTRYKNKVASDSSEKLSEIAGDAVIPNFTKQ